MKLSLCTDVYGDLSFTDMLDKVKTLGINAVEMTAGGWGGCKHVPTQELLTDEKKLADYKAELDKKGHGNRSIELFRQPALPGKNGRTAYKDDL